MGDIQPILAIAVELKNKGHKPVLALPSNYKHHVQRLNLDYIQVGPEFKSKQMQDLIHNTHDELPDAIKQAKNFLDTFAHMIPDMFEELYDVCRNADILISTPYQLSAKMVHEKTGIPFVSIMLSHFSVNGSKLLREVSAPVINVYRKKLGLEELFDPLTVDALSKEMVIFGVSKYILRKSPAWPDYYHVAGFFFLEEDYEPDTELKIFLENGARPIVISFGSMVHEDSETIVDLLLNAISETGNRAIIQKGWSNLETEKKSDNIYFVDFLSHTWLFPKASLIIHHGGAGTTAAALRSGIPSIVVPHALDQPLWAQMGKALQCVSGIIPYKELNKENLKKSIIQTFDEEKYRRNAIKISDKIRTENGVKTAGELIEMLI